MNALKNWLRQTFWGYHAVMVKEWIEILNDKSTLLIILLVPIVQMTIYGFGVSFEVRDVDTVLLDQDLRPQSQTLLNEFLATDYIMITKRVHSREEAVRDIISGQARAAIIIPPDFSDKIQK